MYSYLDEVDNLTALLNPASARDRNRTRPPSALRNPCLLASNVSEHPNHRTLPSIPLKSQGFGKQKLEYTISVSLVRMGPLQNAERTCILLITRILILIF